MVIIGKSAQLFLSHYDEAAKCLWLHHRTNPQVVPGCSGVDPATGSGVLTWSRDEGIWRETALIFV